MNSRTLVYLGGIAIAVVLVRILAPLLWSIVGRARLHGPAAIGSPNSGGRWLGWVVTLLWSLGEHKREESWEYLRKTGMDAWNEDAPAPKPDPLPQRAVDSAPPTARPGHGLMSRDHQQLTEDGQHWWTGREWVSVAQFVPPSAMRSVDGSHWWDGQQWQWVPNEFPKADRWMPMPAAPHAQVVATPTSWLHSRRGHTAGRRTRDLTPKLRERSDPPPTNLPPVSDRAHPGSTDRPRPWQRWGSG